MALEVSFPLPTGDLSTSIASDPPRYWELEVESDAPGIDYLASFLVPVYARQ